MGNVVEALKAGLCDSALSVRIPASWGLGNLCSISAVCSQAPEANAQLLCLFKTRLSELLEAAMQAARDSDKAGFNTAHTTIATTGPCTCSELFSLLLTTRMLPTNKHLV